MTFYPPVPEFCFIKLWELIEFTLMSLQPVLGGQVSDL